MKAIETKAQVDTDCTLTITMQVTADVQAGEYEAMVVLNRLDTDTVSDSIQSEAALAGKSSVSTPSETWSQETADAWAEIQAEVRSTEKAPQSVQNEYHQALIEKYRKQGLNLRSSVIQAFCFV